MKNRKEIKGLLLWGLSCLLLTACGKSVQTEDVVVEETTDYVVETPQDAFSDSPFQMADGKEDENNAAFVYYEEHKDYAYDNGRVYAKTDFTIPQLKSGDIAALKINQEIHNTFQDENSNADEMFALDEYELEFENDEYGHPVYTHELKYEISYYSDNYLCLLLLGSSFGGGAHSLPFRYTKIFDMKTGNLISLSDLVSVDNDTLNSRVAEAFRILVEAEPEEYYANAATEVMKEDYASSDDYYLTENGVTFFYYPYAMSYYARGFVEVCIPFEELGMKLD